MEKIDFRQQAVFNGKDVFINGRTEDAYEKIQELQQNYPPKIASLKKERDEKVAELSEDLDEKVERISNDSRLKEATKEKKIEQAEKDAEKKEEEILRGFLEKIRPINIEYRKAICEVIFEFQGEPPPDSWYGRKEFDFDQLSRALDFFYNPILTLNSEQSNGSSK